VAKIVHFFTDEKFTGIMINLFDKFEEHEQLYLSVPLPDTKQNYQNEKVEYISPEQINASVAEFHPDLIIFHSLFPQNLLVLDRLETKVPICWFSWGGDISLGKTSVFRKSHEPLTFKAYFPNSVKTLLKHGIWNGIKKLFPKAYSSYYHKRTGEIWPNVLMNRNFRKINFVNTVIPQEQEIFKKHGFTGSFIHIPIGTIEYLAEGIDTAFSKAAENTIFLGHSSYAQNNHIDVLYRLSTSKFEGKIICPLSYGDDDYRTIVIETGKRLFGERFIAITDYQLKEQYFNTLKSSKLYLNNSIIQQGVGNIVVAAYLGVPVVLNAKSAVYDYLISIGVRCFTIEKDLDSLLVGNSLLTDEENLQNRSAIESVYGEKEVKRRITTFLDQFGKH